MNSKKDNRKALFFDIDGTLLSEVTKKVPESAVRAVAEARRQGHLTFVNSGRVSKLLDPFRGLVEMDGYLCGCGTYIIIGDQELYARKIPHERGIQIRHDLVKYGIGGVLEGKGGAHFTEKQTSMARLEEMRESIRRQGALSPIPSEDESFDFDKFCCVTDENSRKEEFFATLAGEFEVIDRGNNFWECVPLGHSKATAIQLILDHYGLSLEDAYVFGDSTNDISMFSYVKNAVLMGHHDKELEPYATFVTKTVEDDGIEYAMKELGLIP